jgi:integration host factor subunit beta
MIKSELIVKIGRKQAQLQTHLSENDIVLCVNAIMDKMIESLASGKRIEIRDFGSFDLRYHAARISHNPKTGEKFQTKPKYVIHFKPGKGLKDRVNASRHIPIKEASD